MHSFQFLRVISGSGLDSSSKALWMPEMSPLRSLPIFAPGLSGDRPHPETRLRFGHDHRGPSWCRSKLRPGAPFILEDCLRYTPVSNPRRCCNLDETHMLNLRRLRSCSSSGYPDPGYRGLHGRCQASPGRHAAGSGKESRMWGEAPRSDECLLPIFRSLLGLELRSFGTSLLEDVKYLVAPGGDEPVAFGALLDEREHRRGHILARVEPEESLEIGLDCMEEDRV